MKFRNLTSNDYNKINKLNKTQDFIINLKNTIIDGVVEDKEEIVAYGIVKRQAEAIILVNKKINKISRAKALRELMKVAIFGAKIEKCQQLHCFVSDPLVAQLLKKHFGFVETKDIVLVRNL